MPKTATKLSPWLPIVLETNPNASNRSAKFKRTTLRMLKRRMKILQRKMGMVDPPLRLQPRNKLTRLAKVRAKPAILRSHKRLICASRPCKRLSCRKRSAGSKTWLKRTLRIKILTCLMGAVAANVTMRKGPSVSMPSI